MAIPSQRKYDKKHLKRIEQYAAKVRAAYIEALKEVSKLSVGLSLNKNDEFYFRNHKRLNQKVNKLLKKMFDEVYGTTVQGIKSEWDLAIEKNNELARYVFGVELKDLPVQVRDQYFSNNAAARRAFIARKDNGLKLSQKVWRNTTQFKKELELALELGIGSGKSAQSIAGDVRKYLNDPDMLFRRIREKPDGELRLSKAAKAYSPGQGRYRSSYKNALRLTRNETNFSYERSQGEKREQQSFIVGVEIKVSPSHNPADDQGGVPCIQLQGKYPKDFDFTYKWHVNCKCQSFNIMKTREELDQDVGRILQGKEPTEKSVNKVTKRPAAYTKYKKENKQKWESYKNFPRTFDSN
jgi:hypothetical protein